MIVTVNEKPGKTIYLPFDQDEEWQTHVEHGSANFYVRTVLPPEDDFVEVRRAVQGVNSALPLDNLGTLTEQISGDISTPMLLALLSVGFGLLAVLLAAIGLYGVLAYSTAQRTREIGIRMALGANRFQVVRLVVRQIAAVAVIAIAAGVPLSLILSRYLREELFHVAYNDPWSLLAAALVSFAATTVAAYLPARRAAFIDPMQALRAE